jgi:hypothetical protein
VAFPLTVKTVELPLQILVLATLKVILLTLGTILTVPELVQPFAVLVADKVKTPTPLAIGLFIEVLVKLPPAGALHVNDVVPGVTVEVN